MGHSRSSTTAPIRRGFGRRGTKRKSSAVCLPCLLDGPLFSQPPIVLAPGVHFSKKNIHGSHLEKVKCETRISLHGFLLIKFRKKCEMRVYIFRWSIWEVRNVKFCVKCELNFWKNGLQIPLLIGTVSSTFLSTLQAEYTLI